MTGWKAEAVEVPARRRGLPARAIALAVLVLAGCTSSATTRAEPVASSTAPAASPSSTADPDTQPNPIPFNVGEVVALPGGWRVQVVRVRRNYTAPGLASPPAGQQHVAVDVRMRNDDDPGTPVDRKAVFTLFDQSNNEHAVEAASGDTLVFTAPAKSQLLMILDGQAIGSQRSVFQVDPPTHPAQD